MDALQIYIYQYKKVSSIDIFVLYVLRIKKSTI